MYLESELKEQYVVKCTFILIRLISCTTNLTNLPDKFYIISSGLWFFDGFKFGVFKCEVRERIHVCFTIHLLKLKKLPVEVLLILRASINRSSRCLSLSSVFSNLVHEELLHRIELLIKCHRCNTNVSPQRDRDRRLNDRGQSEEPLKNHGDSATDRKRLGDSLRPDGSVPREPP